MFGFEPSYSAKKALDLFKKTTLQIFIELGAGLGRDTIFFAQNGIYGMQLITVCQQQILLKDLKKTIWRLIKVENHDIEKTGCDNENFEAYCYMLFCMALTNQDLKDLNQEILRVFKKRRF